MLWNGAIKPSVANDAAYVQHTHTPWYIDLSYSNIEAKCNIE